MKAATLVGILLIIVGVAGFIFGGFHYTQRHRDADLGPVHISHRQHKTVPVPPILSGSLAFGDDEKRIAPLVEEIHTRNRMQGAPPFGINPNMAPTANRSVALDRLTRGNTEAKAIFWRLFGESAHSRISDNEQWQDKKHLESTPQVGNFPRQ